MRKTTTTTRRSRERKTLRQKDNTMNTMRTVWQKLQIILSQLRLNNIKVSARPERLSIDIESNALTAWNEGPCVPSSLSGSDMELDLLAAAETESDSESNHSNQDNASGRRSVVTAATAGSEAGWPTAVLSLSV